MKILELHILQSFPVSCLNRDDAGLPKTAIFGGVTRARLSSQCLKRSVREEAQRLNLKQFKEKRTKLIADELRKSIKVQAGNSPPSDERIDVVVKGAISAFGQADPRFSNERTSALYFLAPEETKVVAAALSRTADDHLAEWEAYSAALGAQSSLGDDTSDEDKKKANAKVDQAEVKLRKHAEKAATKALKELQKKGSYLKDAVDIALFGRMAADSPHLNIDGASCFSHALSTHEAEPQQDFYSAVDDILREKLANRDEDAHSGSGMLGVLEFSSATYYRYIAVDMDSLFDPKMGYLRDMDEMDREKALATFIESSLKAIPRARKTGMNANTFPAYALGVVREEGSPLQLINAFECPIKAGDEGFVTRSVDKLVKHYSDLNSAWGLESKISLATGASPATAKDSPTHVPFPEFLSKLVAASLVS